MLLQQSSSKAIKDIPKAQMASFMVSLLHLKCIDSLYIEPRVYGHLLRCLQAYSSFTFHATEEHTVLQAGPKEDQVGPIHSLHTVQERFGIHKKLFPTPHQAGLLLNVTLLQNVILS